MTIHSKRGNADAKNITLPLSKIDPGSGSKTVQARLSRSAKLRTHPAPVMCWTSRGINSITFTSPAMWNYSQHRLFSPGFELKEIEPHQQMGDTSRSLYVKFPPDIPTHNNVQVGGRTDLVLF